MKNNRIDVQSKRFVLELFVCVHRFRVLLLVSVVAGAWFIPFLFVCCLLVFFYGCDRSMKKSCVRSMHQKAFVVASSVHPFRSAMGVLDRSKRFFFHNRIQKSRAQQCNQTKTTNEHTNSKLQSKTTKPVKYESKTNKKHLQQINHSNNAKGTNNMPNRRKTNIKRKYKN